jgi:hypothetical protein
MSNPKSSSSPPSSSSSSPSSSSISGWILYALLSGLCAAANGVFAKLVTTTLTSSWAGILTTFLITIIPETTKDGEGLISEVLTPARVALGVEGVVRGVRLPSHLSV